MNRRIMPRTLILTLTFLFCAESLASYRWWSLPDMVHRAPVVAKGDVLLRDGVITLEVKQTLKGPDKERLTVGFHHAFDVSDPEFKDGEMAILFLEDADANGISLLYGPGDNAKWPRTYPDPPVKHVYYHHFPHAQDIATLEDIQRVVQELLAIENAVDPNEKLKLCAKYIQSGDALLQLTSMEYARLGYLWPTGNEPSTEIAYRTARRRFSILRGLAAKAQCLVDSSDPSVREEAIRLLRYAPLAEAMPRLIDKITDADRSVGATALGVLRTMARELGIVDPFAKSVSDDSPEHLISVQQQWRTWWEDNRSRLQTMETRRNDAANDSNESEGVRQVP
jgi:hypothetical protein